jgi:hypothetical protein
MKKTLILALLCVTAQMAQAQITTKKVKTKPKKSIELKVLGIGGANGGSIAFHPKYKLYYTIIAGNAQFPIELFDEKGKQVQSMQAGIDGRGIMYNPKFDVIEANTYDYQDLNSYRFAGSNDGKLEPNSAYVEIYEMDVQEKQAVMDIDTAANSYVYLDLFDTELEFLDTDTGGFLKNLKLVLPVAKEDINFTTVAYTGIKGGEYAILDIKAKKVYLIDAANGTVSVTINLPKDLVTYDSFNWGYANNQLWFFNKDTRTWTGYTIVK